MARWEIQQRMRKNEVNNLGINNKEEKFEAQYKRSFFVDWRVQDRLKKQLMNKWDYVLDTNTKSYPKLVTGEAILNGLKQATQQPVSVLPSNIISTSAKPPERVARSLSGRFKVTPPELAIDSFWSSLVTTSRMASYPNEMAFWPAI